MTATINCAGCQHAYIETALFCPNCGRPKLRDVPADPLLGKVLGERFLVQALLGQGGSGTIYRAEHVTLRRRVAIKVLHTELSRDDLAVERFRREATTVAEIDNEHIVEIHDFGRTPDGRLYLAMELLEGETLDAVLAREHQLSIERAADILIQVGEALMEAHAIGYVHRDLRPRNIYLSVRRGKANFIKLLDFGLAKLVETEGQAASTSLGMTFGDPRYMSPEQARGDRIDRRADIYQLGCVAYEMLTGAPPFAGSRVFDILTKQVTEAPQPLPTRRPGTPLWMEAAVTKMLAKDPDNRFATTTRMVEALRRGLDNGEVMEAEVARRRESIPPLSVSRVMQRMGMLPATDAAAPAPVATPAAPPPTVPPPVATPAAPPPVAAPAAPVAPAPSLGTNVGPPSVAVPPPAAARSGSFPRTSAPTPSGPYAVAPTVGVPPPGVFVGPASGPAARTSGTQAVVEPPRLDPGVTMKGPVVAPPARPDAVVVPPARSDAVVAPPARPDAVVVPPAKPDSVELLRRRTGTPRIGVPVVDPGLGTQAPVAGVIEPAAPTVATPVDLDAREHSDPALRESRVDSVHVRPPVHADDAHSHSSHSPRSARGKRGSAPGELNISQAWYDEGDQLDDEEMTVRRGDRARRTISPSTTDLSFYDERPRRRWGVFLGLAALAVAGGAAAFVLTRSGASSVPPVPVAVVESPSAAAPVDAPPSTIIPSEPSSEAADPAVGPPGSGRSPAAVKAPAAKQAATTRPPAASRQAPGVSSVPGSESPRRAPALSAPVAPSPGPAASPALPSRPSTPPALTDSPKDPYGGDDATGDGGSPERRAEFFANLGAQQLIGGDTAGAASSFKKASELDGRNVAAVTGLGEIALRQGLFGDAIAHLSRAAKLAPRNAKLLTLLGEAYLNSGNSQQAAAQFKKALQVDPDNARARDGYNEASSRVPPPDDDTP